MDNLNVSKEVYSPLEDSFLLEAEILKLNLAGKVCLDLGTGSGIQAIAMLKAGANFVICADINPLALLKAKENVQNYLDSSGKKGLTVKFIETNLFEKLKGVKFDFIAFNPPYVPSDEVKWVDLDGGKDGRVTINKFVTQFVGHLSQEAKVLLLLSSLNLPDEIVVELEDNGFIASVISQKKLFFEELIVLEIMKIS